MRLNYDKALSVFTKVRRIREDYATYSIGGAANRVSVEDLQRVITRMYKLEIVKTQVPFEGEFVRGLMERYDDHIRIRVKMGQSDDYKRFTAVKEMCHVVIDEKEDWSPRGVETITDLLFEYAIDNDEEAHKATQSEAFAELAAAELMYPFECRGPDLEKLGRDETTMVKIAAYHGIPLKQVSRVLSEHFHREVATRLWQQVDGGR